jgi:hypothetical protein
MKNIKYSILTLVSLIYSTLSAQIPAYVPTSGLVGWYPFNGNANDGSSLANDGTVTGASLTTDRFGNVNSAYSFSSTSTYISTSKAPFVNTPFTVAYWCYLNDLKNFSTAISLGEFGSLDIKKLYFAPMAAPNDGSPMVGTAGTNGVNTQNNVVKSNRWVHIVTIVNPYSINGISFYVDGKYYGNNKSDGSNVPIPLHNTGFRFGRHTVSSGTSYFNGKIDDAGFWNRALDTNEIKDLYNACKNFSITQEPSNVNAQVTKSASFSVKVSDTLGAAYRWQSNHPNTAWVDIPNNAYYSNANTRNLTAKNLTVSNHNQRFRLIANLGPCKDTSAEAKIIITDTCINTKSVSVADTLKFIVNLTGVAPPNNRNPMKVYPNPTSSAVVIDNGNFTAMANYIVKIENSIGQQVFFSKVTQQQFTVDVSTLGGKGVYTLTVLDSASKLLETKKIVLN